MVQFHIQGRASGRPPISEQRGHVQRQKLFFGILILFVGASTITRLIYSQVLRKHPTPQVQQLSNFVDKPSLMSLEDDSPPNSNFVPDDVDSRSDTQEDGRSIMKSDSEKTSKKPDTELGKMKITKTIAQEEPISEGDREINQVDDRNGQELRSSSTSPKFEGSTEYVQEVLVGLGLGSSSADGDHLSTTQNPTTTPVNPSGQPTYRSDILDTITSNSDQVTHPKRNTNPKNNKYKPDDSTPRTTNTNPTILPSTK